LPSGASASGTHSATPSAQARRVIRRLQSTKCAFDSDLDICYSGLIRVAGVDEACHCKGDHRYCAAQPQISSFTDCTSSCTGTGTYFEWLEWSGHVTIRATSGIALHDLKFRGERIVYELSLQELFIAYNGYGGERNSVEDPPSNSCSAFTTEISDFEFLQCSHELLRAFDRLQRL